MKEASRDEINFKKIPYFVLVCFLGAFVDNYFSKFPEFMEFYGVLAILLAVLFGAGLVVVKHRVRTFLLFCLSMILADFAGTFLGLFLHKDYNLNLTVVYKSSFLVFYYTVVALIVMLVAHIIKTKRTLKNS